MDFLIASLTPRTWSFDLRTKVISASPTALLALTVIEEGDKDSAEVYEAICSRTEKDYMIGTVHTSISRLHKKDLIEMTETRVVKGPLRRVYGITESGISFLEEYRNSVMRSENIGEVTPAR